MGECNFVGEKEVGVVLSAEEIYKVCITLKEKGQTLLGNCAQDWVYSSELQFYHNVCHIIVCKCSEDKLICSSQLTTNNFPFPHRLNSRKSRCHASSLRNQRMKAQTENEICTSETTSNLHIS
jgi:hypothetical protein